jgi:hypothetical protein
MLPKPAPNGASEDSDMKNQMLPVVATLAALFDSGCDNAPAPVALPTVAAVVNSLEDLSDPPEGTVTLRSALEAAAPAGTIRFDAALDGGVIELSIVGADHTVLKGEVMGMRDEPSGPVSYLEGYFERNYGKSALYARKDVVIDASDLANGITLSWVGSVKARVLAVYGDLSLTNVTVTGGRSEAEDISTGDPEDQPWTLGRGGAVAVWGTAHLVDCTLYDNHCVGDFDSSRDRGAFGGGIYANIVILDNCVISGNTVRGGGAAGGGVYSVGGAGVPASVSTVERCSITGNRIQALFTYGGGVYSDGGGIGNRKVLELINSTIARNVVEPPPGMPPFLLRIGYWRGGGVYMSNGYLRMHGCTVVENEVSGVPRTDSLGRPNLAGGIAATIGNAHAVEEMVIGHSIVAGNLVHELGSDPVNTYAHDIFTGSLLYFRSMGYNRFGVLDFSHILVPVGEKDWKSLSRKHYPKQGDESGVDVADVLDLAGGVTRSASMLSAGVGDGDPVVLHYAPAGTALDRVPTAPYSVPEVFAEYELDDDATNNFLEILLDRIEDQYGLAGFAGACKADFEAYLQSVDTDEDTPEAEPYTDPLGNPILTLADTQWFGPRETWPKELSNYPYIEFWHHLDDALRAEDIPGMGAELLGDDAWSALFASGGLAENDDIFMTVTTANRATPGLLDVDQRGVPRPANGLGDIGAIEAP